MLHNFTYIIQYCISYNLQFSEPGTLETRSANTGKNSTTPPPKFQPPSQNALPPYLPIAPTPSQVWVRLRRLLALTIGSDWGIVHIRNPTSQCVLMPQRRGTKPTTYKFSVYLPNGTPKFFITKIFKQF